MSDDYLEMLRRKLKRLDKDPGTRRSMLAAVTASEIRRLEQEAEECSSRARLRSATCTRSGAPMRDDDMPFRCHRCGRFVGSQRLHEADDFGPHPCKHCHLEEMTS